MAARLGVPTRASRPVKLSGPVIAFLNTLPRLVFESQVRATGHMATGASLAKRSHCVNVIHAYRTLVMGQQPDADTPQAVTTGAGFTKPFQRNAGIGFDTIAIQVRLSEYDQIEERTQVLLARSVAGALCRAQVADHHAG